MREYPVTTNTDIVLALPALTVTVRSALYVPRGVLPPLDADEPRGRETWVSADAVLAFFQLSKKLEPGGKVTLEDVVDLDNKKIQAEQGKRKTGVVFTDVTFSVTKVQDYDSDLKKVVTARSIGDAYNAVSKTLGEAVIPLWGVEKGDYLLAILPPDKQRTKPDEPAGPSTTIEAGVDRTYRPLYVVLSFDDDLKLTKAETVLFDGKAISINPQVTDPDGKVVGNAINHGYVTAFSASQLAIDLKPDFVRTVRTNDAHKATATSGKWARTVDVIVVHGTGGPLLGSAVNTATGPIAAEGKPYGPEYEIDRDGHNVKFAYDDGTTAHAGPSQLFYPEKNAYESNIGSRSVGIEVVNYEGDYSTGGGRTQDPYQEPQIQALIKLLRKLVAAHPKVMRHRIVGHGDVKVFFNDKTGVWGNQDGGRLTCPGRRMPWPRLEAAGFGRLSVYEPLGPTDYSGLFSLDAAVDFVEKFPNKPGKNGIYLRQGDKDASQKWSGITWTTKEAAELLTTKKLTFKGIIAEMQKDLQTCGYWIDVNGDFNPKTEAALQHFLWHTFSGERRTLIPGGSGDTPETWLTYRAARYLKGSAKQILADIAAAAAPAAPAVPAAPGAPGGSAAPAAPPAHAELEMERGGDLHDRSNVQTDPSVEEPKSSMA